MNINGAGPTREAGRRARVAGDAVASGGCHVVEI